MNAFALGGVQILLVQAQICDNGVHTTSQTNPKTQKHGGDQTAGKY